MLCKPLTEIIGCTFVNKKKKVWLWWALSLKPARGLCVETFSTQPKSNLFSGDGYGRLSAQKPSSQTNSNSLSK
eukprot:c28229_g1_i1 orf=218-439(+)